VDTDEGYLLANEQVQAGTRFGALAALFDPPTFRHLRGIATAAEGDQHLRNIDDGLLPDLATSPMVSARGRRP